MCFGGIGRKKQVTDRSGLVENNEVIDRFGLVKADWRTL
jgi:hypothetical protein